MSNIQKLTYPYFTDGSTQLNAETLNPIIAKMNEMIEVINSGMTPTSAQTVETPTISISGTAATISCSTSGATIRYAINDTPTESSGTTITNGGTVDLSSYSASTVIRAIAYKDGMTTSQVAQETYTPSTQPDSDATAIMARYSKSLTSTQQTAFNTFIVNLKNDGIYNKLHYLVLPVLANDLTEATQNALSGESAFSTLPTGAISFSNNGISPVVGQEIALFNVTELGGSETLTNTDFHFSAYKNNTITAEALAEAQEVTFSASKILAIGMSRTKGNPAGIRYTTADSTNNIESSASSDVILAGKKHFVASFDSSNTYFSLNGTINQAAVASVTGNVINPHFGIYWTKTTYTDPTQVGTSTQDGTTRFQYGLLSWGKALTSSQCTAFNTYVETLMASFIS